MNIVAPKTIQLKGLDKLDFPVIVKPRIGSRSRGIRIIKEIGDLREFVQRKGSDNYVVQKYISVQNEYRMLVLDNKVLGAVDKYIYLKDKVRVGVRIKESVGKLPEKLMADAINISEYLQADFVGVGVVKGEDNKYYTLEANLSPQFGAFSKVTGINVANETISFLLRNY